MGNAILQGDSGDAIVVQVQCFPVVCSTWFSGSSTRAIEQYFRWVHEQIERAAREHAPLVNVTDAGAAGLPDADARRLIAERTKELDTARVTRGFHSVTIVESALIRGALNALAWLHGDMRTDIVGSRREAVERAATWLRSVGVSAPADAHRVLDSRPAKPR